MSMHPSFSPLVEKAIALSSQLPPVLPPAVFKLSHMNITASDGAAFTFPNGIKIFFQKDGNVVAYNTGGGAVAATASNSSGPDLTLVFQEDGNLVVYNNGNPLWASNTGGIARGADLVIKDQSPFIQIVGKNGHVFYTAKEGK